MDGCSSQDGSLIGHESHSRRSRKLSGSRAWERGSEADQGEGGYDIILMTEIPYSVTSLKKLYALIKKVCFPILGCLYSPKIMLSLVCCYGKHLIWFIMVCLDVSSVFHTSFVDLFLALVTIYCVL